jgi:CheY-like chemotaxis protein
MLEPKQLRILCAEDDEQVRTLVVHTLRGAGHHVDAAEDGRAAAAKVEKDPQGFDLIVTDARMPHLGGVGLINKARSAGYTGKFIVFASALTEYDRQCYCSLKVDYVIEKPARNGELAQAVSEVGAGVR